MSQHLGRWCPASSAQWSVLIAASFGLLNLYSTLTTTTPYNNPAAVIGYIVTVAVALLFGLLWRKLVEGPNKVTYLRGGLVGLLAGLMTYLILSVILIPLSILGLIALFLLWLTALYTIPNALLIGITAIGVRKRAGE